METTYKTKTWTSLWTVYILWGSTYFGIAIAVKTMPALLSMGIRFTGAAALLAVAILIRKGLNEFRIPRAEIINAGSFGALRLGIGLGALALAERTVPSGVAALIFCCLPLWVSLFRTLSGDRPSALTLLGIAIGFAGVAILLKPGQVTAIAGADHLKLWLWMAVVLFGNLCWAISTFLAPKFPMPKNSFVSTFYEMLFGGVLLFILGLLAGERFSSFSHSSSTSWFALLYLAVFGSIVGYSAFVWLVANAPVSLTTTYVYVNPVIAVLLGTTFLKEEFHLSELLGGSIVLIGVILVVVAESTRVSLKNEV